MVAPARSRHGGQHVRFRPWWPPASGREPKPQPPRSNFMASVRVSTARLLDSVVKLLDSTTDGLDSMANGLESTTRSTQYPSRHLFPSLLLLHWASPCGRGTMETTTTGEKKGGPYLAPAHRSFHNRSPHDRSPPLPAATPSPTPFTTTTCCSLVETLGLAVPLPDLLPDAGGDAPAMRRPPFSIPDAGGQKKLNGATCPCQISSTKSCLDAATPSSTPCPRCRLPTCCLRPERRALPAGSPDIPQDKQIFIAISFTCFCRSYNEGTLDPDQKTYDLQ